MGQSGESDQQRPRRSLKLGPKKAARTRKLPLVARRTCQGTDAKLCQPPARLLQDENLHAQQGTEDSILQGLAPEESTNGTELASTPPASRNSEELIVPDSPEESWSGKESSRRSCKLSRTRPSSTDFEELVVPESPEESWARPSKSLRAPHASISEELIVPESPEESKDPSHRPWKLRRTGIRKVHLESLEDGNNADLGRGSSELSLSRVAKRSGKLRFKSPAVSVNSNRSHHCDVRLPVLAAEKTSSTISDQPPQIDSSGHLDRGPKLRHAAGESITPKVTDGNSILRAFLPRRRTTATKKHLCVSAEGANEAQTPLKDEDPRNCAKSRGADYHKDYKELHGDSPISYVPDTEDPEPVTPFATISGMLAASSITLIRPRAILGDEPVKEAEFHAKAGASFQGNMYRDVQTPVSSSTATPAPETPFPSAGGKPSFVSSGPLKMTKGLREDELDGSENCAELAGAGHLTNVRRSVPTSKMDNESVVPASSFVTGSEKPVWVCSVALEKARTVIGAEVEGAEIRAEFPGARYQTVYGNGQRRKILNAEDAAPVKSSSMTNGNTLSAVQTKTPTTSTFKVAGKTLSSSRDAQTPTIAASGGAVPLTSFVTGSGKPVSVSSTALKKAKALLKESECSESHAKLVGAGCQGNLTPTTSKFSDTLFPAPINSSSMTMGKTLTDDHVAPSNVYDDVGLITSFVTGSGKPVSVSSGALKKARVLLGGELDASDSCAELIKAQYPGNVNGNFQASKFSNTEDIPLRSSSMANGTSLSSPRHVTASDIDNAVPTASFTTGSGKSLSVSLKSLEKCTAFLGDEFEETATGDEFPGATDQRTLFNSGRNPTAPIGNFESATEMPMPSNYGNGVMDTCLAVGAASTGFCTGSGKSIFVSSSAMEKARMLFCDKEDKDEIPTILRNPGLGNQTTTFKDTFSRKGGIPQTALKKADLLLDDLVKDDSNSGRVTLGAFSTASGNHISVSHLALKKARQLLRDDHLENDDCLTLPRATDDGNQLPRGTNEKHVVGNTNFSLPSLPPAKPGYTSSNTLAKSASTRGPEKGKAPLGDDDKENHYDLECRQALRNTEFAIDRTRKLRPLSEIQPIVPASHSADGDEKFCRENCKIRGSCSSPHRQREENLEGSPFRNRSRKTMAISSEAIQAAKARIAPLRRKEKASELAKKTADFEVKSTFKTASGRTVTISSGAIEKATALLADGIKKASLRETADYLSANHGGPLVPSPAPSFRTSSGRTVFISSEAMSTAKALLAPHDGGLDVAVSPEEINDTRNDNVNGYGTASEGGPCAAGTPHLSNLNQKAKFEQPTPIISKSHQLMDLSSKPSSTPGVDCERRNVAAFKRPRMWNHPDDIVTSKGVCAVNSRASQPQSLNPFTATRGQQQLQPSRLTYLLERVGSSMSGPLKLRDYIGGIPASDSEVLSTASEVRSITSDAAENYRILHVTGGRQESVSSAEISKLLLGLGADTRYANKEWVANHYKWIIWKLASSERKHPRQDARKLVTLDFVLQELKYRYDRELSGHRSAIRSITEGDSSASRTMVLCVSAIRHYGNNEAVAERMGKITSSGTAKIEVTDGWYRLNAALDAPFTQFLQRGKLKVGQKIQVCGATLCCCSQPKPPLEAFQDSFLALHVNGTRRACRNARLGFCRGPFLPLAFRCVKPGGGLVPKTYVGVTRVYPILFREISAAGISIVRSARAEELASNQFEQRRANLVEESILKLEISSNASISQKEKFEGYELFEAVDRAAEPDVLMADMTPTELKAFAVYQAKREVSRQAALESDVKEALQQAGLYSRNVVRLLKVRVAGLNRRGDRKGKIGRLTKEGTITIWDVSDELEITEGSVYCVSGLRPGTWGANSSSNEDRLHLQAYPSASWRHVPEAVYDKHFSFPYTCRAPTRLSEMDEMFVFREFDVAAAVLHIDEPFSCGSRTKQWVFVSDGSTSKNSPGDSWDEIQILAIRLSLPSPAFAPVDPSLVGSVVGCCNLIQQHKDYKTHFLVAEASELSLISSNLIFRPVKHLQAAAESVSEWVKSSRWAVDSLRILIQGLTFQSAHSSLQIER